MITSTVKRSLQTAFFYNLDQVNLRDGVKSLLKGAILDGSLGGVVATNVLAVNEHVGHGALLGHLQQSILDITAIGSLLLLSKVRKERKCTEIDKHAPVNRKHQ